jgi:hypothetical protein
MSGMERLSRDRDVNRPSPWPRGQRGNRHTGLSARPGILRQRITSALLVALVHALVVRSCSENMLYPWQTAIRP